MSELTQELIGETIACLEHLYSGDDSERVPAEQWILDFREKNPELYMFCLIRIIALSESPDASKAMAAVLLYSVFHKRTYDLQRDFNSYWSELDISIRNELCEGATQGIYSGNDQLIVQCANILGAFFVIEFPLNTYEEQITTLLEQTSTETDPNERLAAFSVFKSFTRVSLDFCPSCGKDQMFYQFSPVLFQNILSQMNDSTDDQLQHLAASILGESLSFFFRPVSFPATMDTLMRTIFEFIQSDNLFTDGFKILRKTIDFFYNTLQDYKEPIVEMMNANIQSENNDRIIQSCMVLHLIGDVESDIETEDKTQVKLRHRDFDTNFGFSVFCFDHLLESLLQLIMSIEETDTFQSSPQLAAFICIADLAKAVGEPQKDVVVGFVNENLNSENPQLRFASVLMTSVALQIPCFVSQPQNILGSLSSFIEMLGDTVPLVLDVTMWCLGKVCQRFSDLAMNGERFNAVCQRLPEIIGINDELADRGCWLLKQCIISVSKGEESSVLCANFSVLSQFLCEVADGRPKASNQAFAALTQLIESAPSATPEECENILQRVVSQLKELIPPNMETTTLPLDVVDRMIWICSIVENITFFVGEMIAPIEEPLMQMLLQLVKSDDIDLVRETLPAMGAIACTIGPAFSKYAEELLTFLPSLLSGERSPRSVRPAALLLGDMYTGHVILPKEVTTQFAGLLIQRIESDEATETTKSSLITVLGTIVNAVGSDALEWIDNFMPAIMNEVKSNIEQHEEMSNDIESTVILHLAALTAYKAIIPVLAEATAGFKRAKSIFFIFELVSKYTQINPEVLKAAVDLIEVITEILGRPLHVILNSGVVIKLLEYASQEGDEETREKANETLEKISTC